MKLSQYLKQKHSVEFDVIRVEFVRAENTGEKIALLYLKAPIPRVEGSQTITDDATSESVRLEAFDVDVVKVNEKNQDSEGISIDENGVGTVKCDLRLDVSKAGDVWMTDESFAMFGRKRRGEFTSKRASGILTKIKERKAAFGGNEAPKAGVTAEVKTESVKPEVVAAGGEQRKGPK